MAGVGILGFLPGSITVMAGPQLQRGREMTPELMSALEKMEANRKQYGVDQKRKHEERRLRRVEMRSREKHKSI